MKEEEKTTKENQEPRRENQEPRREKTPAGAGKPREKDLFRRVKEAVPVPELAGLLGLDPREGGMVRCPFHEDHTPSLKLYDDHFHCFGCRAHGDAVDLVVRMTGLTPLQAARALADQFHVEVS